jgi:hypothetical protein
MNPILGIVSAAARSARRMWTIIHGLFARPYRTLVVQDRLPLRLRKRTLYLVEEDGYQEQAAMMCPCGCGSVLHMNLLADERPCWRVTRHEDGTASLHPSVWRNKECSSHFWLRRSRIHWCRVPGW